MIETRRRQLRWSRYRLLKEAEIDKKRLRPAYYFLDGKYHGDAQLINRLLEALHLGVSPRAITTERYVDKYLYDVDWEKEAQKLPPETRRQRKIKPSNPQPE